LRKQRVGRILRGLRTLYPDANCALEHESSWQLLASTILSAQSTDETVNKVTPGLFARYPTPEAMAAARVEDVEGLIYATGFFRQKTKSLIGSARLIVEEFVGEVPGDMDGLLRLPGVARKTANVVLGTWFGKNEGVVVDTHVGRLADRLQIAWRHKDAKDAKRIELDLCEVVPRKDWTYISHALIWHGRKVCTARRPNCAGCKLAPDCPSAGLFG
jgi:endonuclease-3